MRMFSVSSPIVLALLLSGCALWPSKKEFFQKEVPVYPEQSYKDLEATRQAAHRAKETAVETLTVAIAEGASPFVLAPAEEVAVLADAVSTSVGPPLKPARDSETAEDLAAAVLRSKAVHNRALGQLRDRLQPLAGKDVEGTGRIQVGYFTLLFIVGGIGLLAFLVLRAIVTVAAQANPGVALGASAAGAALKLGGRVVSNGFAQVLRGGEAFKKALEKEIEDPELVRKVRELFRQSQEAAQDEEVKVAVKAATGVMKN